MKHTTAPWALFGGEPLMIPLKDIDELLSIGFARWGQTGVQTNGIHITEKHVDLFAKYRTYVGISLDGPDELNDTRWAGTVEATRKTTARTHAAIDMLLERAKQPGLEFLTPSLIITLQKGNAHPDVWPKMKAWLWELDAKGIKHINVHLMEMDHKASEWYLPHEQLMDAMRDLWELSSQFKNIKFLNFKEIVDLLRGKDEKASCVWRQCSPWSTSAVQGLDHDGAPSLCSRVHKDGINWLPQEGFGVSAPWQIGTFKESTRSHERQLSLYVTPQEHGGCAGCEFWMQCGGRCPGEGVPTTSKATGDWRLRTSYCATWKELFREGEKRLLAVGEVPISRHPDRLKIEAIMYQAWAEGEECDMSTAIKIFNGDLVPGAYRRSTPYYQHGDAHGDHTDYGPEGGHGDAPHGDSEHGDSHGDSDYSDSHGDHTDATVV